MSAGPRVDVDFAKGMSGLWDSVKEPKAGQAGKWTPGEGCIRAGEEGSGVLNLLVRDLDAANLTVETRLSFRGKGAPSLLLRAQEAGGVVGDCYSVVLYQGGINLWRRVDGRSSKVAQAKLAAIEDRPYRLRAAAEGWRLRVWLDDVLQVDVEDATLPLAGRAGLWAGEGLCQFYTFAAEAKPVAPTGTEPVPWLASGRQAEKVWAPLVDATGARLTWGGGCSGPRILSGAGGLGVAARSDAKEESHYNGLMIPVPSQDLRNRQLVLDFQTATPGTTQAIYVRLYDAAGKRVASWNNWQSPLSRGPLTVRLQPGQASGDFVWETKNVEGDCGAVTALEIIAGTRLANADFDLTAANLRTAPPPPSIRDITAAKPLQLATPLVAGGRAVSAVVAPATSIALARKLQARLRELSGVEVPVVEDIAVADAQGRWNAAGLSLRNGSLILLGNLQSNRLLPLLYARLLTEVDGMYPGPGGYALHTVHDPWGNGRNVVVVGGSDDAGVTAAMDRLLGVLAPHAPGPEVKLPRLLDLKLSADLLKQQPVLGRNPDPKSIAQTVEKVRAAFFRGQHTGVTVDLYQAGFSYARSGNEGYAELFKRLAQLMMEIYRSNPGTYGGPWGMDADFHSMQVFAAWDLVEECPVLSDADRLEITRILAEYAQYIGGFGNVPRAGSNAIRHNHNTFPSLGALFAAEYFGKYYGVAEAPGWLAAADACFQAQARSFKPQEDSNGYQWLTVGHLMRYALARPDHSFFANGNAKRTLDLGLLTMDNLGYQSAFGDVGGWRGWASEVPLWSIGAWYFADPAYRWAIARERAVQPWAKPVLGGYETSGLQDAEPQGYAGMRCFPIERKFYDYWTAREKLKPGEARLAPVEQGFEKISFRQGFDPLQAYLLLDGIGTGGHRHFDGNSLVRYTDRGREWFADGDYIKALPKFHTSLLAFRDGQSSGLPPYCALEARADLPTAAMARSTLRDYGGADWARNVVWLKGTGFVVIDSVRARAAGDYSLRTVWHTLGEPSIQGQRYTAEQQGERFVLDNLDGARLKLTNDASLGKNWAGYPHAAPVVRILQQIANKRLQAGERHCFLNVFSTSPSTGEHPVKAERVSGTSVRVTVAGEPAVIGVTDGKLVDAGAGMETDALAYVLRTGGFALAQACVLRSAGQTLFHSDAPINVEVDAASGRAIVESCARRTISLSGQPNLVVGPGRQEVSLAGQAKELLSPLPPAAPIPARPEAAATRAPLLTSRWTVPGEFACLACGDLTGDKLAEILTGDKQGVVRCWSAGGQPLWEHTAAKAIHALWAGDLDGDGRGEVLAGSLDGSLSLLDAAGKPLWTHAFPYYKRTPGVSVVFPADLDGDGKQEIIAGAESWHFYALDRKGAELWHYESVHGSTCGTVADFEGKGCQSVIAGTEYYWWHAITPEGKKRWSYSTETGPHANAVAAGDLNGDGKPEVVFGGADGNLHVLSESGTLLWSFNTGDEVTAVAVRDVNGDQRSEVIATSMSFNLYVLDGSGKVVWRRDCGDVLSDLACSNGAGSWIAVAAEDGRVAVFRADGTPVGEAQGSGPAVRLIAADLDGNGGQELVVLTDGKGVQAFAASSP